MENTVVAIATPPGEGAIGIIRMTGLDSIAIASKIFKGINHLSLLNAEPRKMYYGHIVDGEELIDEVMIAIFKGPYSYTKEDMVEIYTHGGFIALNEVFNLTVTMGATPAEAGEFTKRAFLNGRLDLAQAESIMELVSAKSKVGYSEALNNLKGKFSERIGTITSTLTDLIAKIEVLIDYPDEDIELIAYNDLAGEIKTSMGSMASILASYETGKIIKDGIKIAIVGKPNVGKSSLMNALLKESRSIVTHIPGTTRDIISENIMINGIAINIIDTAGIRDTEDLVEQIGVQKAKTAIEESDIVLFVVDLSRPLESYDFEVLDAIKHKRTILIFNKADLEMCIDPQHLISELEDAVVIKCSIIKGSDILLIENSITDLILESGFTFKDGGILTNARHFKALNDAHQNLLQAYEAVNQKLPLDIVQYELHCAYSNIGEITGSTIDEDVVASIFKNFCLGK